MSHEHETTGEDTAALHALLGAARDALCGCGRAHPNPDTVPGAEWAAVPIQCGTILHHTFARLLNYWHTEQPCAIDDYLEAAAYGVAKAGDGQSGAHVGAAMMRILWHWYEHTEPAEEGDYWGEITEADRHRMIHALAEAVDTFNDVMDDDAPEPGPDVPEHIADAVAHLRGAAASLGCGAANVGLDHMSGTDRAYMEAVGLAGVVSGRIGAILSQLGGEASSEAVNLAQRTYPVAAVGAAAATSGIDSERMAASVLLGTSMPLAWWFRDHAETVPRAGAVWRLTVASTMLADADTIAEAERDGYADRLGARGGSEAELVAKALELMREAVASIELETR